MTAEEILEAIRGRASLRVRDGKLEIVGGRELPAELLAEIDAHRDELIALLPGDAQPARFHRAGRGGGWWNGPPFGDD